MHRSSASNPAANSVAVVALLALASPALHAEESMALADGSQVIQQRHALRWLDTAGRERASIDVRGKHLDARSSADEALVITTDADTQRVLLWRAAAAPFRPQATWFDPAGSAPGAAFAIEAACLYRDPQRLDHLVLIGKDGRAEEWLLPAGADAQPRRYRFLSLPPNPLGCRVDDASGLLYVGEEGLGVWAYAIAGESVPRRYPVALREPYGPLAGEAAILRMPRPGVLAAFDEEGKALGEFQAPTLAAAVNVSLPQVVARVQTQPVARLGDAADDPAIWIHPREPGLSRVLGTNKKQGLLVYDLAGKQRQLLESGRLNNVDLRQAVRLGGATFDIAVATQRDELALVLYDIDAEGEVTELARVPTGLPDIYGLCLYQPRRGGLEVFVNDKDGRFLQYRLAQRNGRFSAEVVRRFAVSSQPEGCVADDRTDRLFLGEEKRGLWVTSARADRPASLEMVLPVGPLLVADTEGVAIRHGDGGNGPDGRSYLVVSSQGNSSYVVLDAAPPYTPRGAFRVGIDAVAGIDGTSDTDGLDVTPVALDARFPRGMLVVQDGYKRLPDGAQDFKYVDWRDVARVLSLP